MLHPLHFTLVEDLGGGKHGNITKANIVTRDISMEILILSHTPMGWPRRCLCWHASPYLILSVAQMGTTDGGGKDHFICLCARPWVAIC